MSATEPLPTITHYTAMEDGSLLAVGYEYGDGSFAYACHAQLGLVDSSAWAQFLCGRSVSSWGNPEVMTGEQFLNRFFDDYKDPGLLRSGGYTDQWKVRIVMYGSVPWAR